MKLRAWLFCVVAVITACGRQGVLQTGIDGAGTTDSGNNPSVSTTPSSDPQSSANNLGAALDKVSAQGDQQQRALDAAKTLAGRLSDAYKAYAPGSTMDELLLGASEVEDLRNEYAPLGDLLVAANLQSIAGAFSAIFSRIGVLRFYNSAGNRHFHSTQAIQAFQNASLNGYVFQEVTFPLLRAASTTCGKAVYRCKDRVHTGHFLSNESKCEGYGSGVLEGYACERQDQPASLAIVRLRNGYDHIESVDQREISILTSAKEGWKIDGHLGFAPTRP